MVREANANQRARYEMLVTIAFEAKSLEPRALFFRDERAGLRRIDRGGSRDVHAHFVVGDHESILAMARYHRGQR